MRKRDIFPQRKQRKNKEYFKDFDFKSRKYFRTQNKLVKRFSEYLEKSGVDDVYFDDYLLNIEFFKELKRRVIEHEILSRKNKTEKEKQKDRKFVFSVKEGRALLERESKKVVNENYS